MWSLVAACAIVSIHLSAYSFFVVSTTRVRKPIADCCLYNPQNAGRTQPGLNVELNENKFIQFIFNQLKTVCPETNSISLKVFLYRIKYSQNIAHKHVRRNLYINAFPLYISLHIY